MIEKCGTGATQRFGGVGFEKGEGCLDGLTGGKRDATSTAGSGVE